MASVADIASNRLAEPAKGARAALIPAVPKDGTCDTLLSRALFSARVVDHLATGSTASVALVELPCLDSDSSSEPILAARKTLLAGSSREALLREATALRAAAAASPFVCRGLGWAEYFNGARSCLALLTEYADGGSLQDELDALVQIRRQQALEAEAVWQQARAARAAAAVTAALAVRGSLLPLTPPRPATATAAAAAQAAQAAAAHAAQPGPQAPSQPLPLAPPPTGCHELHSNGNDSAARDVFKAVEGRGKHRGSTCSCPLPATRHDAGASSGCGAAGAVRCLSAPPPSPATPEPAAAGSPQSSWQLERGEVSSARRFLAYPDLEAAACCTSPAALAAAMAAPSASPHLAATGAAAPLPLTILRLPRAPASAETAGAGAAPCSPSLARSGSTATSCCSVPPMAVPGAAEAGGSDGDGASGGELSIQMLLCGGASSFFSATSSSMRGEDLDTCEGGEGDDDDEVVMGGGGGGGCDLMEMELEDCADSSCAGVGGGGAGGGGRAWLAGDQEDGVEMQEAGEQQEGGQELQPERGEKQGLVRCASFSSGVSGGESAWASAGGDFGAVAVPPVTLVAQSAASTEAAVPQPTSTASFSHNDEHENESHHQPEHPSTQAATGITLAAPPTPSAAAPAANAAATKAAAPAAPSVAPLPPRMPPNEMLMAESRLRVVTASLLHALHGLHVQGFVHLHITPANVLCSGIGRVLLADFGTARCLITAPHAHSDGLPCYHHLCPVPPACPTSLLLAAASAGARAAATAAAAAAAAATTTDCTGSRGRASAAVVHERLRSWAAAAGDAAVREHVTTRTRAAASAAPGSDGGGAGTCDGGAAATAGAAGRPSSSASVCAAEAALMVFTAPELRSAAVAAATAAATAAAMSAAASPSHAEIASAVHAAVAGAVHAAATPAADMYSLGALLTSCAAWHGDVGRMRAYQRYETDMPAWVPPGLRRLVEALLDEQPAGRPSAAAALCDPYLSGLSMADLLI